MPLVGPEVHRRGRLRERLPPRAATPGAEEPDDRRLLGAGRASRSPADGAEPDEGAEAADERTDCAGDCRPVLEGRGDEGRRAASPGQCRRPRRLEPGRTGALRSLRRPGKPGDGRFALDPELREDGRLGRLPTERAATGSSSWSATTAPTSTPSGPASGRRSSCFDRETHTASRPAGRDRAPGAGTAPASRPAPGSTRSRRPRRHRRARSRAATSRRRRATSHAPTGSARRRRASAVASGAGSFPSREPTAPAAPGPPTSHSGRPVGRPSAAGRSVPASPRATPAPSQRPGARVLAYGTTWAGGGLRCASAETGLTCRNRDGHGFFLSRERWRAF